MATSTKRRSSSSVTNLFSDIVDDIKDFVDDEIFDRLKDTEKDVRKAGRNWFDDDDDYEASDDEIAELQKAVKELTTKVNTLAKK